ncbi:MAG: hypothetical protein MJ009_02810 [Paludibacteraceae bacterium]|nr:hypothetical protein [Paludibacteraceae bacterium]
MAESSFQIISRRPEKILMEPFVNIDIKSPFNSDEQTPDSLSFEYRLLLETCDNGTQKFVFTKFMVNPLIDKCIVVYKTPQKGNPEWEIQAIGFKDIFDCLKRINSVYLEGTIMGLKVQAHQRPDAYNDFVFIDGFKMNTPMKFKSYIDELKEQIKKQETKQQKQNTKELKEKEQNEQERLRQQELRNKTKKDKLSILYHLEQTPSESEIIEMAKKEVNKCFMALLLTTGAFDTLYASEIKEYFNNSEITSLARNYSISELKEMSEAHDKYFEIYMKD